MQKIIIDEEFKALLPALDEDTYAMLEENLLQNGCRDSIVLWGDILIDGHNRYEICSKHDIEFNTIGRDFASREEALIWIISTQVSRRNLSQIQLSHFRGLHYMADKKIRDGNQNARKTKGQNDLSFSDISGSTAKRLAAQYRVSAKTINRDAKVAKAIESIGEVSGPAKNKILSGEAGIDKYKLGGLCEKPKKEIEEVAIAIENGTYEKQNSTHADPDKVYDKVQTALRILGLAVKGLNNSLLQLPENRSIDERAHIKQAINSCIFQLENQYRRL